ncbi:hypothetical protein AGMMS50255_2530 [Spirochaetia bacterium]|nr:hypothetical protein AGMMS50255_2530 [Spirochaetia bacterium]
MVLEEWNMNDALEVRWEEGRTEGWTEGKIEDAKRALKEGLSVEVIQRITGLDTETITSIAVE